jgi:hypothetical protein
MEQNKNQLLPGIFNLVILKPPETLGPLHGYGITRRSITRAGRQQLAAEEENWRQISEILTRFIEPWGGSL